MKVHKIISSTSTTKQVAVLAEVEISFPSGKQQIRKMSFTRHLQLKDGKWQGLTLPNGKHMPVYMDYTDAVKAAITGK